MIQSGIGQFENIQYRLDGKKVTLSQTITFSKAFNNPPVVVVNVKGAGFDFSANGVTNSNGGVVVHQLISYELMSSDINKSGCVINLEVLPRLVEIVKTIPINIDGLLIKFSWIAYDEVTIGA